MTTGSTINLPTNPRDRVRSCTRLLMNSETRLLTLTGVPGVGKTWLARELVSSLKTSKQLFEAAYEIDLANLDNWLLFLPYLSEQLGLESGQQSLWALKETVVARLSDYQTTLLVLDAFEVVLPAAATLKELLQLCPGLKVIVTSRVALELANEHVLRVPALATPNPEQPDRQNESVQIMTTRAQQGNATLVFSDKDLVDLARLSVYLEGLPLALLAAAQQLGDRTPEQLLADLEDATYLKLWRLASLSRHATLFDALEWRFLRLSSAERTCLECASVVIGDFDTGTLSTLVRSYQNDTEVKSELLSALEARGFLARATAERGTEPQNLFSLTSLTKDFLHLKLAGTSERAQLLSTYAALSARQPDDPQRPEPIPEQPVRNALRPSSTSYDVDDYGDPFETDRETLALLTEPLTERELDVLRWVVRGLSNREVARHLDISHRTVSTHLSNIYGKLNVRTRTAAALRARQLDLVPEV